MREPNLIELAAADLTVRLCPELGGTIASFERHAGGRTVPVLSGIPVAELNPGTADRAASFPMVPFANRAPGNVLRVGEATYRVRPNTAEPNALHGSGWQSVWRLTGHEAQTAELTMETVPGSYPFSFLARQAFRLSPEGLSLTIGITNTHDAPIPAGLGHHPYFPRHPGTTIQFTAPRFWLEGPGYLPTDAVTTPPELDFSAPKSVPERWRNNCYSGWDGRAEIVQPELGYRLVMTASALFSELMFFTPPGTTSFAMEPQSHSTAATDTEALIPPAKPLVLLQPGETLSGTIGFEVSAYLTA